MADQFNFAHNTSVNSCIGTTPYEIVFGFKPKIPISLKLHLVRDDNALRQSEFCQSLPNHTHVKEETNHSCIDNLLSSKSLMDLLNEETQFKNVYRKAYGKVREANHRSLAYRNKYKLAKPFGIGEKVLAGNHHVPFGESQKLCELQIGPCIVTKVITKIVYQNALDADPTRTQVVHRNHLAEFFPRDNEIPNLFNYEKPFIKDETKNFYNECAMNRMSQLNQSIDSFVEQQQLHHHLPMFPDTPGTS